MMRTIVSISAAILISLSSAAFAEKSYPECRNKVQEAAEAGIMTTLEVTGRGVEVGVDPAVWRQVDYGTKMGMVWSINCLLLEGDTDEQVRVVILNSRNHHVMGEGYPSNFDVKE